MSKLSELIDKLCPNGVEYKKLGEICEVITGGEPPVNSVKGKSPSGNCIYPIYANGIGENALWGFSDKATVNRSAVTFSSIGTIGHPTIRNSGFTPIIRLKVIYPKNEKVLSLGFLKYALEVTEFKQQKSSLPNINASMVKGILIPLPPLEIQREVVEILDKFAQLTAQLTAELQKRKKQYEHYRDFLLEGEASDSSNSSGFRDSSDSRNSRTSRTSRTSSTARTTRWVRLGEICEMKRGRVISKDYLKENKGEYPVYSSQTLNEGIFGYISTYDFEGEYLTWTTDGANAGSVFYHNGKFSITNVCGLLKSKDDKVSIKYLFYWLKREARKYVSSGMGNPKLMSNTVASISIPLPPLAEQERIVAILDRFDSLCNSLTEGLPAEIALRKKQYEYYRDKLLDFNARSSSNSSSSSLEPLE